MKKAVLREYLKNREMETITIDRDKFFVFEVEDADVTNGKDTFGEIIKKAAKEAIEIYEEKAIKPKKTKKGDK